MAKKLVSVFIEKEQEARLDKLSAKTRVLKATSCTICVLYPQERA